jgi:hypothetical protein
VVFYDGGTALNNFTPSPVTNGVATYTTSSWITGTHTLTATYSGNNTYASSTSNSLTYRVYSVAVVDSTIPDDGSGTTPKTFSYVLSQTQTLNGALVSIIFIGNGSTVTILLNKSLTLPSGVKIDGGNTYDPLTGPTVIFDGNGTAGDGLVLNGENSLSNVWIKGFGKRQLVVSPLKPLWKKVTLQWVKVSP